MKTTKLILASLFASVALSQAATTIYTVTTGTTTTSSGFANSAGLQFQSSSVVAFTSAGPGIVSYGYFNISDSAITGATDVATLTGAFQNWNTSGNSVFNAPGPTQQRGVFSITAAARDITAAGFDAKNMYVFVGNGTTYGNSTEFAVLKTTFTFNSSENGPTGFTKTISTANSSVLIGSQVANVFTTSADASTTSGWRTSTLAAVPEPSAALLGMLGALGLLRRRR